MKRLLLLGCLALVFQNGLAVDRCREHLMQERGSIEVERVMTHPSLVSSGEDFSLELRTRIIDENIKDSDVTVSISVFGVEVERKRVSLCESAFCHLKKEDVVSSSVHFSLHQHFPSNTEATITIEHENSCFKDAFHVKNSLLGGSLRFSFSDSEVDFLFQKWLQQHKDNIYLPPHENSNSLLFKTSVVDKRREIFKENLMKIALHNSDERNSFSMGMNQFGHLTVEEFQRIYSSGLRQELSTKERHSFKRTARKLRSLPKEVNWVKEGAVTEVKNQGACGSCWSFASTGALEGAYFLKTGKLVSFSEQELVACDTVDLGCNGGAFDNAFQFVEANKGLCSEQDFPYSAGQGDRGTCDSSCSPVPGSAPKAIVDVTSQTEEDLLLAVSKQPVAVAIEADETVFQFYSGGVLKAPCAQRLDHGVLAVGYGTEEVDGESTDFWLVKNSWGPMWGLNGYIKLARGVEVEEGGECGILLGASYPQL